MNAKLPVDVLTVERAERGGPRPHDADGHGFVPPDLADLIVSCCPDSAVGVRGMG